MKLLQQPIFGVVDTQSHLCNGSTYVSNMCSWLQSNMTIYHPTLRKDTLSCLKDYSFYIKLTSPDYIILLYFSFSEILIKCQLNLSQ